MTPRIARQHLAGRLGAVGAALGMVAGTIQASVGSRIPGWTGSKASPVALGLLTLLLSAVALAAAVMLRSIEPVPPRPRALAAVGLLVPGALCFSTVGRLWYLPGALMLSALAWLLAAGSTHELAAVIRSSWMRGLVSLLGAFEILMAVSAGPTLTVAVGIIGGAALIAAPWVRRRARLGMLIVGTLPFAALTWWSLVGPLLAVVALAIGLTTAGHGGRPSIRRGGPQGALVGPLPVDPR
ncbi:MAG: hypothetical protein JWN46_4003 [Acidimicrobiales bacterium]|nr:hypothetical protein [Acidimicrobiales bacterium]